MNKHISIIIFQVIKFIKLIIRFIFSLLKKLFYFIYIKIYLFSKRINSNKYILFAHGSVSDTLYMASLLDAFNSKFGQTYIIASNEYIDIFRIYTNQKDLLFLFETEEKCRKLRSAISVSGYYKTKGLFPGIIRPLHGPMYPNYNELTLTNRLSYRDMITWIMGLDRNLPYNYITNYSKDDYNKANELLSSTGYDISKIALINPICYTHKNISVKAWEGVAEAISSKGFHPIFNLKSKIDDNNSHLSPINYQTINIPAYLVPLCSEIVGIGCARLGGGFDLLQSYCKKGNNNLLILLSDKVSLLHNEKNDLKPEIVEEYILNFSGRFKTCIALLDDEDSKDESYSKTILALTNYL